MTDSTERLVQLAQAARALRTRGVVLPVLPDEHWNAARAVAQRMTSKLRTEHLDIEHLLPEYSLTLAMFLVYNELLFGSHAQEQQSAWYRTSGTPGLGMVALLCVEGVGASIALDAALKQRCLEPKLVDWLERAHPEDARHMLGFILQAAEGYDDRLYTPREMLRELAKAHHIPRVRRHFGEVYGEGPERLRSSRSA